MVYCTANSCPMPTTCEPCPGKTNAVVCESSFINILYLIKHKRAVFVTARCGLLWVLLFFFDFKHFSALIMSAVRADRVRQAHRTAIGTRNQITRFQCVMGTATIATAFGMFALGMWGHDFLLYIQRTGKRPPKRFLTKLADYSCRRQ